jgi:hypothetical protein
VLGLTGTVSIRVQNSQKHAKRTRTASPMETVKAKSPKYSPDTITPAHVKEVAVDDEKPTDMENGPALQGASPYLVLDENLLDDELDYNDEMQTPGMAMVEVEFNATQNGNIASPATTN